MPCRFLDTIFHWRSNSNRKRIYVRKSYCSCLRTWCADGTYRLQDWKFFWQTWFSRQFVLHLSLVIWVVSR